MSPHPIGRRICERIDALAAITADPPGLTRIFLSPEQGRATELVLSWMRDAGMEARVDAIGNAIGRYEGAHPGLPALALGSHLDTVRNAGKYDGMLGVVTAIDCVDRLHREGRRLDFAIEVMGFSDEEGVRFGATMLGSDSVAGRFDPVALDRTDRDGISMRDALIAAGFDPAAIPSAARSRDAFLAYVELHIEQGPVLESRGLPVGCVTAISGASRYEVTISGMAGHAGTVPMGARRDALAAAAECILMIEARCGAEPGLVGTVGKLEVESPAINVIPGRVRFTIDVRAPADAQRDAASDALLSGIESIAARRGVAVAIRKIHDLAAAPCAPWLMERIDRAIAGQGIAPFRLPSGAGHDAMAMIRIADIGMIFVRCAGGISHNPAESITEADAEMGAQVLFDFIAQFAPEIP